MFYAEALRYAEEFHVKGYFVNVGMHNRDLSVLAPSVTSSSDESSSCSSLFGDDSSSSSSSSSASSASSVFITNQAVDDAHITHDPQIATLSPYQLFFSRSFMNAVTPHLVMSQTVNPFSAPKINLRDYTKTGNHFEHSYLDSADSIKHMFLNALIDHKFLILLATFAETFQFTPRLTFVGIARYIQAQPEKESFAMDLVFGKILNRVRFHNLEHLDLRTILLPGNALTDGFKYYSDAPTIDHSNNNTTNENNTTCSSSAWNRPQLLRSLNLFYCFGTYSEPPFRLTEFSSPFLKNFCPFLQRLEIRFRGQQFTAGQFFTEHCPQSLFSTLEEFTLIGARLHPLNYFFTLRKFRRLRKLVMNDNLRFDHVEKDAIEEVDGAMTMFKSNSTVYNNNNNTTEEAEANVDEDPNNFPGKSPFSWVTRNCSGLQVLDISDNEDLFSAHHGESFYNRAPCRADVLFDIAHDLSSSLSVLAFIDSRLDGTRPNTSTSSSVVENTIFKLENLEVLLDDHCAEMTPELVSKIPDHLPQLRFLGVNGVRSLASPEGKAALKQLKEEMPELQIRSFVEQDSSSSSSSGASIPNLFGGDTTDDDDDDD